jgi:hypothetical protein
VRHRARDQRIAHAVGAATPTTGSRSTIGHDRAVGERQPVELACTAERDPPTGARQIAG